MLHVVMRGNSNVRYYLYITSITLATILIPASASAAGILNIFVSILPQKYLVERIGADKVTVSVMVKPGVNPETYEPTPKQMAAIEAARLYFRIAVPFESVWIGRLADINPDMKIIPCCGPIPVSSEATHQHHNDINDGHVWTSPMNAIIIAGIIRDALTDSDPDNSAFYQHNYQRLVDDLTHLHEEITSMLSTLAHRYLIVSHPAWGFFTEAYNLTQISLEQKGSEIRARQLSNVIQLARKENIRTVFTQKQVNAASARVLANEINGRVVELDPLAENYIDNLYQVAESIRQGAEIK